MTKNKLIFMAVTLLILSVIAVIATQLNSVSKIRNRVLENRINQWQNESITNKNIYQKYLVECRKGIDQSKELSEQIKGKELTKKECNANTEFSAIYEFTDNIDYSKINIPFPLSLFISEL